MSKNNNILIVEDDESIREALEELLVAEGYQVYLAEHGQRALEILNDNKIQPALILLDLSMPVMDGPSFLMEIGRQFPVLRSIPVITMTAAGPSEIPPGLLTETIMRKPLEVDVLMSRVESILGHHHHC